MLDIEKVKAEYSEGRFRSPGDTKKLIAEVERLQQQLKAAAASYDLLMEVATFTIERLERLLEDENPIHRKLYLATKKGGATE